MPPVLPDGLSGEARRRHDAAGASAAAGRRARLNARKFAPGKSQSRRRRGHAPDDIGTPGLPKVASSTIPAANKHILCARMPTL